MPVITRPAALVRQGNLKLYATSITVRDLKLPGFYQINKLDPAEDGPGFQRLLNTGRARKLTEYLLEGIEEGDAFLPTSLFLATSKNIPFDGDSNSITFDVAEVGPFNVVDGQHRIAGLVAAAEKDPDMLSFEVPVNVAVNLDDVSQMCHFLIVNTTQRSVDKAVEQQIVARLTGMIDLEHMPTIPKWIRKQVEKGEDARALQITNTLNGEPSSPWVNKIEMANEPNPEATISQKSFVSSLKRYIFSVNNPLSDSSFDANRSKILINYWKAIAELLVDPESSMSTVIFKTIGLEFFHITSATVFLYLANRKDFKKDTIKTVLEKGFKNLTGDNMAMASPEWWQRGSVASGLNSSAVRKLANAFSQAVNVQDAGSEIAL